MSYVLRRLAATLALSLVAASAHGAITVFTARTAFDSSFLASATDTFDDLLSLGLSADPLSRVVGPFAYTAAAAAFGAADYLIGLPDPAAGSTATWLSTNAARSVLTLDGFSAGVAGIGGSFFATDFAGNIVGASSATLTATFASGARTEMVLGGTDRTFLGFLTSDPKDQLQKLTFAVDQPSVGGPYWLTAAGLTIGTLSVTPAPFPVPEPSSAVLIAIGVTALWAQRRTRRLRQ